LFYYKILLHSKQFKGTFQQTMFAIINGLAFVGCSINSLRDKLMHTTGTDFFVLSTKLSSIWSSMCIFSG
jgi:hypothetical protein